MREVHRKRSDIDLLLFDLDGTLVDSVPQLHLAVDAALQGRIVLTRRGRLLADAVVRALTED